MCWCPGAMFSSCTPAGRCSCTGSSTSPRFSPMSSTSIPVSSNTSRTAASSGSSPLSMWPPGGSHIPSLRWKWSRTLSSHTTNTATVKCLPVCSESMVLPGYNRVWYVGSQSDAAGAHNLGRSERQEGLGLTSFPEEAFRRTDETPDEEFYRTLRLVTHIDEGAIAAITQLYREFFPA